MGKILSRRNFLKFSGLVWLSLTGCRNQHMIEPVIQKRVSYKLEDLCDTEVDWKDIKVYVYIKPSDLLWNHHKYKDKMFEYVSDFFKEQKINCEVVYSDRQFTGFHKSNEFGIEVIDSKKEKEDRYWQLSTRLEVPEDNPLDLKYSSLAVTKAQVALIDGRCRSLTTKSQEEIKEWLLKKYENKKDKESLLKNNASHFCHEILHCMGLPHVDTFSPNLIEKSAIPNMMLHDSRFITIKFTEENSLGYCLTSSQQKLIHSYIARKNVHKAFVDSYKDMTLYLGNLAEANNVKLKR